MTKYCKYLAKDYVKRLKDEGVDVMHDTSTVVGPWVCVGCAITLPRPQESLVTKSEAYTVAVKFSVMYIHVDSFVDSPAVSAVDKEAFVSWMLNPSLPVECPKKAKLLEIHSFMEARYPDARLWMDELTQTTVSTYRLQYINTATKTQLLHACLHKGGLTLVTLHRLIFGVSNEDIYKLGSCMQLLDDIIDCTKDMREGINTYCTYTIKKSLCLDGCATRLIRILATIGDEYSILKTGMYLSLKYTILKSRNFSPSIRTRLGLEPECKKSASFLACVEETMRKS